MKKNLEILQKKNSKYSVFVHYGTSIPHKYSIFIQQLNLFHFRKKFSQKTVRIGSLVVRP